MKKKLNKQKVLKEEIKALNDKLNEALSSTRHYKGIIEDIKLMVSNDSYFTGSSSSTDNLLMKVQELFLFRKMHEGVRNPMGDVIENQREIIRWLIKPSTADNSKELEYFKKIR